MLVPALLLDNCLYFDQGVYGWREAVGDLACGFALRKWGIADTRAARLALAKAMGTPVTDDGAVEAPRDSMMLH